MTFGTMLALVLLVAAVVVLFKAVRMVPQGYEWTVEAFGKYTHTLSPGLHFLVPIYQGIGRKINMMEQVMEVPSQDVITKDNAVVKVDGVVYFQVLDAMGPDRVGRHTIAPLYHTLRGRRRPELVRRQGSVKIPAHPRNGGA